mmetsp:Transcript_4132/g.11758  ORF Transcript_4132/g.11758 Transcript_4132/m.11758 type:complete len:672 (-) Transcript_4132:400-2415(-)
MVRLTAALVHLMAIGCMCRFGCARNVAHVGCTAIAIDGRASVDGSAFAGMNADAANADFRLTFVPSAEHGEGRARAVYTYNLTYPRFVGYGRGPFYHPVRGASLSKPVGHLPEVRRTFGYHEATQPLMNEHGLGLGESSCAAMLLNKFPDVADTRDAPVGLLDTVSMMQLALERCATARCAVELIGALAEEYGFVPTPGEVSVGRVRGRTAWDDGGEAFTLADARGEAWVLHVLGGVSGVARSVWAARRVPPGHIAVVANDFTIGELPDAPTEDLIFGASIFAAARAAGLWDGRGPLHFAGAFAPDPMAFESPPGETPIPLYASLRRWAVHGLAAPSARPPFDANSQSMPFSVRVEGPWSHRDVMRVLRYQYQGTEFDMTKGVLSGPFGSPFRLEGGPTSGQVPRGIAISRTLYSIIVQAAPRRSIAWFTMDTPTTSVYVPLYSGVAAVAAPYSQGSMERFSRDSAWWAFNLVNNYMNLNYAEMSSRDVYPAIESWQNLIDEERSRAERLATDDLAVWQVSVQERLVDAWWNMSEHLFAKYNDFRINSPSVGEATGYPRWFAEMVGFSNDVHPLWAQACALPPPKVVQNLPDFVRPSAALPFEFDFDTHTWSYRPHAADPPADGRLIQGALLAVVVVAALGIGVWTGALCERRRQRAIAIAASEACYLKHV